MHADRHAKQDHVVNMAHFTVEHELVKGVKFAINLDKTQRFFRLVTGYAIGNVEMLVLSKLLSPLYYAY